ncbi:MAG: NUDIX domain-containing protein [bacterium]|nr:NUDIX domain-containing protein [bacterium]
MSSLQFDPAHRAERVIQFCPRCGAGGFEPRSDKRFDCHACGFVYYINACGAVAGAIRDDRGRILFTVRAKEPGAGMLDLPGGFIDHGETAEDALRREIGEELNLELTRWKYICSLPNQYPFGGFIYHTIDLFFLCEAKDLAHLSESDEVTEWKFIHLRNVREDEIGFESIRNVIAIMRLDESMGRLHFD